MAGVRLNTPCTRVLYQAPASTLPPRSTAYDVPPGSTVPSWRSRSPYPSTPAAITMRTAPVAVKNFVRLMCRTRRYSAQHRPAARTRPIPAPVSGPADSPAARAVVHRNSAVSRPSRPTARNEVTISMPAPMPSAPVTFSRISREKVRAERRIQNTIAVTNPTATTLSAPPNASWAVADRDAAVKVSTAPKLSAREIAARTPVHTCGSRDRAPDRTNVAMRTETMSPASRPSLSPMRKLGNASSHMAAAALPDSCPRPPSSFG